MKVVVAGGGAAGSLSALLLARAGHVVTVLEQDSLQACAGPGLRPSAPHLVQPHALNARSRQLLRARFPDFTAELLRSGALERPVARHYDGDDEMTMVLTRRCTFDLAVRTVLARETRVEMRTGVRVHGLVTRPGTVPHVVGLETSAGRIGADLVVDATGRRTAIDRWLAAAGARTSTLATGECGLAYFSRHYRLKPGSAPPDPDTVRLLVPHPGHLLGLWVGDNATVQLAVVPLAADRRFRSLRDSAEFTRRLRADATFAAWLDALDPISEVHAMGGLRNTLRRLVRAGRPVITGLHVVGDSLCTTNPTLSRGLALAMTGATDLAAITTHSRPAEAYDACIDAHVAPYFTDQVAIDRERLDHLRNAAFGTPLPPLRPDPRRVSFAELRAASGADPVVDRAFWRVQGMTTDPERVYSDPDVVHRTRAALERSRRGAPAQV